MGPRTGLWLGAMNWRPWGGATLCVLVQTACAGPAIVAPPAAAREAKMTICTPLKAPFAPFELVVVGSGGPRGFGRAAASYLLVVEGKPRVLVDVGPGAFVRLGELDVDFTALDTVLLTHLHIDHAGDLPGFVKSRDLSADGPAPMTFRIFGPTGAGLFPSTTAFVDRLFGDSGAFAYLRSFRQRAEPAGRRRRGRRRSSRPAGAGAPARGRSARHRRRRRSRRRAGARLPRSSTAAARWSSPATSPRRTTTSRSLAAGADLLVYDTAVVDPAGDAEALQALRSAHRAASHRRDRGGSEGRRARFSATCRPTW